MKRRRCVAVGVCVAMAAPMVMSSPAAAGHDFKVRFEVTQVQNAYGWSHQTAYNIQVEGHAPADVNSSTTPQSWDWEIDIPCGQANPNGSRVDWFHDTSWGCPDHPYDPAYDHQGTIKVTWHWGHYSWVCSYRGNVSGSTECPLLEGETEEGDARIASSRFPLATRIEKAKKQLKPQIDPLLAEYQQVEEAVVMKQRSVESEAAMLARRLANIATIEDQISRLREDIADGIGSEDSEEMQRQQKFLPLALKAERETRLELQERERGLQQLVARRDALGKRLLEFVEPLEALDFELTGLVVNAGGKKVYEVDVTSPYSRLFELTRQIRGLTASVDELLKQKQESFEEFQAVHRAASAQLLAISDLIWENAKTAAAVDFASNTCDVMIAGAKGGVAGIMAELASKIFETALKEAVAGPQGDPNPGKEAVEAWFRATTTETVGENARTIAIERAIKESVGKSAKSWLADKLKSRWPELGPDAPPNGTVPRRTTDVVKRMNDMIARLKGLRAGLQTPTFSDKFAKWTTGSTGRKLLQDAGKTMLKRELQDAEMRAWRRYILLDTQAQGLFGVWQSAANAYWEAEDELVAAELEKERILSDWEPDTAVGAASVQEKFKLPATLRMRLIVPNPAEGFGEIPVQVWVNGVQARRTAATVFELSTKQLSGTEFAIEVR